MEWVEKYVRSFDENHIYEAKLIKLIQGVVNKIYAEFNSQGFEGKKISCKNEENTTTIALPNFKIIFTISANTLVIDGYDLKDNQFGQVIVKYEQVEGQYSLLCCINNIDVSRICKRYSL